MRTESALDALFRLGKNLKIATNVDCIDKMLNGGFEPGEIYELVGEQAVGKTQILYSVAVSFLCRQAGNAAWIDINGSFITRRFLQFLGNRPREEDSSDFLSRIYVAHAFDASDIKSYLKQILNNNPRVKLILIDNIGSILSKCREPSRKGDILSVIELFNKCINKGITIILTNHLVTVKGELMPSLGITWRKQLITRYLIGRDDESSYFRVTKLDGDDYKMLEGESARFSIYSNGISDFDDFL